MIVVGNIYKITQDIVISEKRSPEMVLQKKFSVMRNQDFR